MESKQPIRILAIDPGTRFMGVAVLENDDLIYATVKLVRDKKMSRTEILKKAKTIIADLILDYDPQILAVEKAFFVQSKESSLLTFLTDQIKHLGKKEGLRVYSYSPTTARKYICHKGRATKMKAALTIATDYYPWLYRFYEKDFEKSWWEDTYWTNMFDAIALGLTCYLKDVQWKQREKEA
jgi:Holliday junction resolvasome RuvABC endonuclease subunit